MKSANTTIDVFKFLFSILVVGIHTEPFGWNIWLDRGFGIITRLCVPLFFAWGGYFFFQNKTNLIDYIKRMFTLYLFWSIVYLPFDVAIIKEMDFVEVIKRYFWVGNDHALWYLCGSIIATIFVCILSKWFDTPKVLIITSLLLLVGCMASTWNPLIMKISEPIGIILKDIFDILGTRTGITYGAVYVTVGKYLAEKKEKNENAILIYGIGFFVSLVGIAVESLIFVVLLQTKETILWIFVLPATYFLVNLLMQIKLDISYKLSIRLRKMSTLIYVSHSLFVLLFSSYVNTWKLFLVVLTCSFVFSLVMIGLCKKIKLLRYIC